MTLGLDASLLAHVGACALGTLVIVGVVTFLTQARRSVSALFLYLEENYHA